MDILLYLIILTIGIFIGSKNLLKESIIKSLDRIQAVSLLLLLFVIGISIGMDKNVIISFVTIGGQALVLAIFSIIFSILGVKSISKHVFMSKEKEEESDC